MPGHVSFRRIDVAFVTAVWLLALAVPANSQSTPTLQGSVVDPAGAIVAGAIVTVRHQATGLERVVETDGEGSYQVAALPVGNYLVKVQASGFQTQIVENLIVEVGRLVVQDFQLGVGDLAQEVIVTSTGSARPTSLRSYRGNCS